MVKKYFLPLLDIILDYIRGGLAVSGHGKKSSLVDLHSVRAVQSNFFDELARLYGEIDGMNEFRRQSQVAIYGRWKLVDEIPPCIRRRDFMLQFSSVRIVLLLGKL